MTAAITIRTFEAHREEFRATVLGVAVQTGCTVEEVNAFVRMELQGRVIGPRLLDRVVRWKTGRPQPEDEDPQPRQASAQRSDQV